MSGTRAGVDLRRTAQARHGMNLMISGLLTSLGVQYSMPAMQESSGYVPARAMAPGAPRGRHGMP